jgi:hypothetical protein
LQDKVGSHPFEHLVTCISTCDAVEACPDFPELVPNYRHIGL